MRGRCWVACDGSQYLHVTDDRPVGVVEELDADLRHVTGVAGAPEDAVDLSELDWLIHVDYCDGPARTRGVAAKRRSQWRWAVGEQRETSGGGAWLAILRRGAVLLPGVASCVAERVGVPTVVVPGV